MAFIQVPTLIERKRYTDGMGGISTSPGAYRSQLGAIAARRGARKRSRSRLGTLSSGAMGSLGDDASDSWFDSGSSSGGGLSTTTPATASGGGLSSALPGAGGGWTTTPAAAPATPAVNTWGIIGNVATAVGKIVNPGAYASTYPYPYAQPASSLMPLLLIGGGIVVVVMLMKK